MANIPKLVGAPDFGKLVAPEESLGKRLEGKRVLLTGTTKGVGRVTQELLCAQGAFVCGSGRSKGVAAEVANELVAKGYKAAGFDVDLSDYEAVKKWVADCAELMGGIDIVINNASHPGMAPFGTGNPGYSIKEEFTTNPNNSHEDGALAMARSMDPNSAGSQFYLCLGAQPMLDSGYTVFGQTIDGMDVIGQLRVGDVIESVEIENAAE